MTDNSWILEWLFIGFICFLMGYGIGNNIDNQTEAIHDIGGWYNTSYTNRIELNTTIIVDISEQTCRSVYDGYHSADGYCYYTERSE